MRYAIDPPHPLLPLATRSRRALVVAAPLIGLLLVPSGDARAGAPEIARGKPATQSSSSPWDTKVGARGAVDGIKDGTFGFHTDHQQGAWWQVDLGEVATLERVVIYNRTNCCDDRSKRLQVQVSSDGKAFTTVYHNQEVFGGVKKGSPRTVPLPGTKARYVRLQLADANYLHLDEVEVYGTFELARGKAASQSSTSPWDTKVGARGAVDGVKDGTYGFHTAQEQGAWWQVDLGRQAMIDHLMIYNRGDCCAERAGKIGVLVSDDGNHWRKVYQHGGAAFGGVKGAPLRVELAGARARHVRLQLADKNFLHLDEVEVHGVFGDGPPSLLSHCGKLVQLRSWKGDYLSRPTNSRGQGVSTDGGGIGTLWSVECSDEHKDRVRLRSWLDDALARRFFEQGVTSASSGLGTFWAVEEADGKTMLRSLMMGDYLHRPDSAKGVTSWPTGIGNQWTVVPHAGPLPTHPLAEKFAPILKFDRASRGYPMSAQFYYERMQARDPRIFSAAGERAPGIEQATLDRGAPTYYQILVGGAQVRIHYWWYYGLQHACNDTSLGKSGRHHGDWEHVTVILREDREAVAAVTYYQHGAHYTRVAGPRDAPCTPSGTGRCAGSSGFPREGTHPVVYVGKISHGAFHNSPGGPGGCGYWEDWRNPSGPKDVWQSWANLVSLAHDSEPWMAADRGAKLRWGPPDDVKGSRGEGGVTTQPTKKPPSFEDRACAGSPLYDTLNTSGNGCYQSECLAGDDQASEHCLKECEPGYVNTGLTCTKTVFGFIPSGVYGRLNSGKNYRYDYKIPKSDVGLTRRRRKGNNEWSLP